MPPDHKNAVRQFFGDSVKAAAEFSYVSLGIGMVLGVLIGLIPIPIPGVGTVTLGIGGGPLIVALIAGKLRRTGPLLWVMPLPANIVLRNFGLALFLATVGVNAGTPFVKTVSEMGLLLLLIGVAVLLAHSRDCAAGRILSDENSLRRPRWCCVRCDRQSGYFGLFNTNGADRASRYRICHDLSVHDHRQSDSGPGCRFAVRRCWCNLTNCYDDSSPASGRLQCLLVTYSAAATTSATESHACTRCAYVGRLRRLRVGQLPR